NYRRRVTGKRRASSRHLIDHSAQRKKIGARIEPFAASLLRRHVSNSANRTARASEAGRAQTVLRNPNRFSSPSTCELGEAEIQNLHLTPLGNENIRRLNVAMDDALGVRGVQRVRQLNAHIEQAVDG